MKDIVLQTKNLTKKYGAHTVLDDVSIELKKKHIYGFIGENGAGKSTFLKIVTGLTYPSSGTYSIMGKENAHEREKMRRCIGCMIEEPALYPYYTVMQNLELKRTLVGNPDKAICNKVLDMVDLSDVKNKRVHTLSMGMKQRLSIAMALVGNPQLLILDEPINGLDPKNIVVLRNLLKKLNEERNITIFISSHILSELYLLATDYIFIHKGKIIDVITHEELEARCRKYICIKTDAVPMALTVLDKLINNPEYKVVSEDTIYLYSNMNNISKIAKAFVQNGIVVTELFVMEQTLEDYFITITGGVEHV
ncbi:MAG: ABC transporter ATP-binding protein [Acutalibacteraceae bacterium]|nr:ABC transporter ATP-binding protein [Acutalibacteraceae bacterium]MEE1281104.1 ABC transporter ATP-binding protein [Acutalibacteraceae bacterium]